MARLSEKQIYLITNDFYSHFCGVNVSQMNCGVHFVCLNTRNEKLRGFNCKYTIYILVKENLCVVSYAPKYMEFFEKLKGKGIDDILKKVEKCFRIKKMQLMIFKQELVHNYGAARVLSKKDFKCYENFFRFIHPKIDTSDWIQKYFEDKVRKEYFTGYFVNDSLVSVCDAPDMPYMEDAIQHTGIVTLSEERKKGYAKLTTGLATHNLIEKGICPQWECQLENAASIALAESIGYIKYGIAYIVEE